MHILGKKRRKKKKEKKKGARLVCSNSVVPVRRCQVTARSIRKIFPYSVLENRMKEKAIRFHFSAHNYSKHMQIALILGSDKHYTVVIFLKIIHSSYPDWDSSGPVRECTIIMYKVTQGPGRGDTDRTRGRDGVGKWR